MTRESATTKAARLLAGARLTITEVSEHRIAALCRGQEGMYRLGWNPAGWSCTCPNLGLRCSHLIALRSVVLAGQSLTLEEAT